MMNRLCIALLVVGLAGSAQAQDDDDLTPLAPLGKPKPKPKPKPKVAPKPAAKPGKPKPVGSDDDLAPLAPIAAKGDLSVKLNPAVSNAMLLVDGKEIGTFPMAPQSIPSGEHTITVKRAGYAAFVKKVLISGGKTLELDAKLTAVAAVLSVTSDQDGAQVLLNGRSIGVAPLNDVEIPPGPAEVAVIKEGYREESQKINFVAGRDYPVVVKFSVLPSDKPLATKLAPTGTPSGPMDGVAVSNEPITSKWYFWVGVGVAVVAAAAGTTAGVVTYNNGQHINANQLCTASQPCDYCVGFACPSAAKP